MSNAQKDSPQFRPRISLRGKGWEIMRGIARPETAPGPEADRVVRIPEAGTVEEIVLAQPAGPEYSKIHSTPARAADTIYETAADAVRMPKAFPGQQVSKTVGVIVREAVPSVEMNMAGSLLTVQDVMRQATLASLTPVAPEELSDFEPPAPEELPDGELAATDVPEAAESLLIEPETRAEAVELTSPDDAPRPEAGDLFGAEKTIPPSIELLEKFVTDQRLERLWSEFEQVQANLVSATGGIRSRVDVYQKDLLQGTELLLADRANYDDARAILYRVKVDLARDEKAQTDIAKYKPRLLVYLSAMLIVWIALMLLEPAFAALTASAFDRPVLNLVYHPTLFGMLGAIVNAYFTLNKHTVQQRDFDPTHLSWYVMNPVIGSVMGLLMTLVFGTGIVSTLGVGVFEQSQTQVVGQYPFLLWVLAFLAGYNQNVVLQLLTRTFNMLRGTADENDAGSGPLKTSADR